MYKSLTMYKGLCNQCQCFSLSYKSVTFVCNVLTLHYLTVFDIFYKDINKTITKIKIKAR
jgi:hypothetical protein